LAITSVSPPEMASAFNKTTETVTVVALSYSAMREGKMDTSSWAADFSLGSTHTAPRCGMEPNV
jgi:hypothetical protein